MNKTLFAIIGGLAIIGGVYVYLQKQDAQTASMTAPEDFGSYPYVCETGAQFTMSPSSDMSTVRLAPGANAPFQETTLAYQDNAAGARYEGGGIVFVGAGEGVTITMGETKLLCNPVPNHEMAPFNFGDAGEGGGVKQDAVLIVSESIIGKWESVDDGRFVREFKEGDVVIDMYNDKEVSRGSWTVFTKERPAEVTFPIEENAVYVQLIMAGAQRDTINFKVIKLTPEELELTYMDRGGVLRFKAAQ